MKNSTRLLCVLVSIGSLIGCTTAPVTSSAPPRAPETTPERSLEDLQSQLGLSKSTDELGLFEKRFNTCKEGITNQGGCRDANFVLIQFRIQCRDSVDTVDSVSHYELEDIANEPIRWKVGYYAGNLVTNSRGYGQIRFIASGTSRNQRVTIHVKENYLGVKASEISRIVVPRNWCS